MTTSIADSVTLLAWLVGLCVTWSVLRAWAGR